MNRARIAALSLSATCFFPGCTIETGVAAQPYGMAVAAPPPQPILEVRSPPARVGEAPSIRCAKGSTFMSPVVGREGRDA